MAGSSATPEADTPFLSTVDGEIAFFRSVMRARPVGLHRHFHVLTIRNWILRDANVAVPPADIWAKLREYYNLEELEALEPDGFAPSIDELYTGAHPPPSPNSTDNLFSHPYFRAEFALPQDPSIDALLAERRVRATPSPPESPVPVPPAELPPVSASSNTRSTRKRRGRSSLDKAGLVSGDSDSSALTQESGDEGAAPTPRESAAGGTDAGTEDGEDGEEEEREESPAAARRKKPPNKRQVLAANRARALAAANAARASKRKKRG